MSAELIPLHPIEQPVMPPPGWTVSEQPNGRWRASRAWVVGEQSGASLEEDSQQEAARAARRFEGVRR
jgi:hypothetical protein